MLETAPVLATSLELALGSAVPQKSTGAEGAQPILRECLRRLERRAVWMSTTPLVVGAVVNHAQDLEARL